MISTGIIFSFLSVIISVCSVLFSVRSAFNNSTPLYFKLPIGAVGCFALHQLQYLITVLCEGIYIGNLGVWVIGIFGCFFFLLSANYGQLDGLVDDRSMDNKRYRIMSLLAPFIQILLITVTIICLGKDISIITRIITVLVLLPTVPASYYCLKHLLLPVDELGFLNASKAYNITALAAGILSVPYVYFLLFNNAILKSVFSIIMSVIMLGLIVSCRKGVKIWKTLV